MSESYPLTFSDVDQKMYEKLDAATRDLYEHCLWGLRRQEGVEGEALGTRFNVPTAVGFRDEHGGFLRPCLCDELWLAEIANSVSEFVRRAGNGIA